RYGQRDIDRLIDQFAPHHWEMIALGEWTTKDLVGHLGVFEVRFAEVLCGFAGDHAATNLRAEPTETFNDDQAAIRRDWTVAQIVDELRDAHQRTMSYVTRIAPETW